jgi:hypothetical protein
MIHSLNPTKTSIILIKLDMSKSFDKLSWKYIHHTLLAFGFSDSWIRWFFSLTSTALFLTLIDGSPMETFLPSRGIQQGYPISPFLFILIEKGMGKSLKVVVASNKLCNLRLFGEYFLVMHQ